MLDGKRFGETEYQCASQMGTGSFVLASTENDILVVQSMRGRISMNVIEADEAIALSNPLT